MESETKRIKDNPSQEEKSKNDLILPQNEKQEKPLEQNAQQVIPQQQMIPQGQQQPALLQQYLQNQQPFIYQQPYGQPIIVGQPQMIQPTYIIVNQHIRNINVPLKWPSHSTGITCPFCSEKGDTKICNCFNICTCLLYMGICLLIPLAILNGNAGNCNCSCSKDDCCNCRCLKDDAGRCCNCLDTYHYCPKCNKYLGRYSSCCAFLCQ